MANKLHPPAALHSENVGARILRSALIDPPTTGSQSWPQYTYGAHNNTPPSDSIPGMYVKPTASGWTAGFFPDSVWHMYNRAKQARDNTSGPSPEKWLKLAQQWTDPLALNINLTTTHDLGFLAKPFESALKYNNETKGLPVLAQMSNNLAARFVPEAGVPRS